VAQGDVDEVFAAGQLEVGALTTAEYRGIIQEGAILLSDPLDSRDEVLRWRRYLRVSNYWRHCPECEMWTGRKPGDPCKNCGSPPETQETNATSSG
jgi:hypothetical protein